MKPPVVTTPNEMFIRCDEARKSGKKVAFVPTMGALHAGHVSLVDIARTRGDLVIVSIFVNPKQFGPAEDLDKYPRTLEADREILDGKADVVFAPTANAMYPHGFVTEVSVPKGVSEGFCGDRRPGHFDGVALVVTKLFNIVGPCAAVFGRKDYQQLQVIKRFTADLNLPVEIVSGPTVRESDGLAMSSRNAYLSPKERTRALSISRGLTEAHRLFEQGNRNATELEGVVRERIEAAADRVDYITAADPDTLAPISEGQTVSRRLLIAAAAFFGTTRLIDNTVLGEDTPPIDRAESETCVHQ